MSRWAINQGVPCWRWTSGWVLKGLDHIHLQRGEEFCMDERMTGASLSFLHCCKTWVLPGEGHRWERVLREKVRETLTQVCFWITLSAACILRYTYALYISHLQWVFWTRESIFPPRFLLNSINFDSLSSHFLRPHAWIYCAKLYCFSS